MPSRQGFWVCFKIKAPVYRVVIFCSSFVVVMKKLPISVCIISSAEAHRIGATLSSVVEWVSEIVVVLNEDVQDGTDLVVEKYGGKVFREPWRGFVGQKNSVSAKATQPWILGLDADEVVSDALRDEIIRMVESKPNSDIGAYEFPRCTFYFERWIRHGDWYPDRVIRLWRRDSAEWTGVEPHAYLAVKGRIARLKSDLLHYSNQGVDQQLSKIAPYSNDFVKHQLALGRHVGFFELVVRPGWRFLRAFVFKLGFLDGWAGYYVAWLSAFSTLTRYFKVLEEEKARGKK
jgi:hypothetical protein